MAQRLRALTSLTGERSLIPTAHMVTHNHLQSSSSRRFNFFWPLWALYIHSGEIYAGKTPRHIK